MAQNTPSRELRVFISSTFNDLQKERKILMSSVFPKLVSVAAERGVVLTPIDLRWGVVPRREGKSRSTQIIDACLREIDEAQCFIGIVGEREGWLPDTDDLGKSDLLKGEFEELVHSGMSMTEIEMQYGVLRRKERGSAFFFVKEIEDGSPVSNGRLRNELYRKEKELGYTLRSYSDANSLSKLVEEAVLNTLDSVYPGGNLSQDEKEDLGQQFIFESLINGYVPDESLFREMDDGLKEGRCVHILSTSEGDGKRALLANWIARHKEEKGNNLLVAFIFLPQRSNLSTGQFFRRMCRETARITGSSIDESLLDRSPSQALKELCRDIPDGKQLVLAIGGANERCIKISRLLHELPPSVKIIFSSEIFDYNSNYASSLNYPVVSVINSPQKRVKYIRQYLVAHRKDLDNGLVRHLAEVFPGSFKTLRAMLDILILFGRHDNIRNLIDAFDEPQDQYVDRETRTERYFYESVVLFYETVYPDIPVKEILAAIAFVKPGIKETEIADFVGISPQEWIYFKAGFLPFWGIEDGFASTAIDNLWDTLCRQHDRIREDTLERAVQFFGNDDEFSRQSLNRTWLFFYVEDADSLIRSLLDVSLFKYLRKHDNETLTTLWERAILKSTERKPLTEFAEFLMDENTNGSIDLLLDASRFCIDSLGNSKVGLRLVSRAREEALKAFQNKEDDTSQLSIMITRTISEAYLMEGKPYDSYRACSASIDAFLGQGKRFTAELGMCIRARAEAAYMMGLYEQSLTDIAHAETVVSLISGKGDENYIKCLISEGRIHRKHGDLEQAMKCLNKALMYADTFLGYIHNVTISILLEISQVLFLQGKIYEAYEAVSYGMNSDILYDTARFHFIHGLILSKKRLFRDAMEEFQEAADILERIDRTESLYSSVQENIEKCNKRLWFRNLFKHRDIT